MMVQFRAPLWELVGPHRYGIYTTSAEPCGTFLPAGDGDRWLYGIEWDPDHESLADYPDQRLVELIAASAGKPDLDVRIERIATFSFAGGLADRWRRDRVFLVGDAAHRVTPRGGTGMNTAIAGGFDLGVEARLGSEWVGARVAARHLRNRTPAPRRTQPQPIHRPGRQPTSSTERTADRSRRTQSPTPGCRIDRPRRSTSSTPA